MPAHRPNRHRIAADLTALVTTLQNTEAPTSAGLIELVDSAQQHVSGAQYAGITRADLDAVTTVAATHRYPNELDAIQQHHQQGPCLTAARDHHTVIVDDLTTDQRWPRFRDDVVAKTPIRSILAFDLAVNQSGSTALNFYAETPGAFNNEAQEVGLIFATNIALAWTMMRRSDQFRSALASRDVIGQAKGMIMERYRINALQAFELLKRLSQSSNAKLAELAIQLIEAEELN